MMRDVMLRTAHGYYVRAVSVGSDRLALNVSDSAVLPTYDEYVGADVAEGRRPTDLPGARLVSLRHRATGRYASAQPNKRLEVDRDAVLPWEQFELVTVF
jgi:hypothetical protein